MSQIGTLKNVNDDENKKKRRRCVYSAAIARKLIHRGFSVVDIKPDRNNRNKTVFLFEETEDFNSTLGNIVFKYKKKKRENEELDRWYDDRLETIFTSYDLKPNFDVFEIGHPLYDPSREWTIDWDCD